MVIRLDVAIIRNFWPLLRSWIKLYRNLDVLEVRLLINLYFRSVCLCLSKIIAVCFIIRISMKTYKLVKIGFQLLISNFDILLWTSLNDIVGINEVTSILEIIDKCDVKYIMTVSLKTIMSVLKILTYIITNIAYWPIELALILVIMSVSTFKSDVILYLHMLIWILIP
jgi:hypothetical protein